MIVFRDPILSETQPAVGQAIMAKTERRLTWKAASASDSPRCAVRKVGPQVAKAMKAALKQQKRKLSSQRWGLERTFSEIPQGQRILRARTFRNDFARFFRGIKR